MSSNYLFPNSKFAHAAEMGAYAKLSSVMPLSRDVPHIYADRLQALLLSSPGFESANELGDA